MAGPVTPGAQSLPDPERSIVERLGRARVLPVLTATDPRTAEGACRALADAGLPCVEITYRTAVASEAIAAASRIPGLVIGAGTVVDAGQVTAAARAGARFGVAPGLSEDVVAAAHEAGLPFFPGVATPSEADHARRLGCRVLKVFPAAPLGAPAFLRAVAAPFPGLRFIPTGGINDGTISQYLAVPSVVACGGSWLCEPDLVAAGRFDEIRRRAQATLAALT